MTAKVPSNAGFRSGIRPRNSIPARSNLSNLHRLCHRCSELTWLSFQPSEDGMNSKTLRIPQGPLRLRALRETANAGCHLCCLVLGHLENQYLECGEGSRHEYGDEAEIEVKGFYPPHEEFRSRSPPRYIRVYLYPTKVYKEESSDYDCVIRKILYTNRTHSHFNGLITDTSEGTHPFSGLDRIGGIARAWLKECMDNHNDCVTYVKTALPSRVIEVEGKHDCMTAKLFLTGGRAGAYVALSHRWGIDPVWKLSTKNLYSYQAKIDVASLSLTIQEALKMTVSVGLRFLWVDSLCIIQDSVEDWQRESAKMANIYRKAALTIAACGKKDVDNSCAPSRDLLTYFDCLVAPEIGIGNWPSWEMDFGLLGDRGWTFQELLLSPRLICCGGNETGWKCTVGLKWDRDPTCTLPGSIREPELNPIRDEICSDMHLLLKHWYLLVSRYSKLSITLPSDRLPALSGLALLYGRSMYRTLSQSRVTEAEVALQKQGHLEDNGSYFEELDCMQYMCGIWVFDLLRGLGWSVHPDHRSEPGPHRAPSWSWASVYSEVWDAFSSESSLKDDLVAYDEEKALIPPTETSYITILSIRTNNVGLNPFGAVSGGRITMLGPISSWAYEFLVGPEFENYIRLYFDHLGEISHNSVFLRLTSVYCLILELVEKTSNSSTYRRIGLATRWRHPWYAWNKYLDKHFEWTEKIICII